MAYKGKDMENLALKTDNLIEEKNLTPEEQALDISNLDYSKKYSNEFYQAYIESFEKNTKSRWLYKFLKRLFDIIFSIFALLLFSPIFIITAIAIKIDSKGPILFKQKRVGKNGKIFTCYKFRSMKEDAPHECATSLLNDTKKDPYTKVGRIIRKLSIDELPQLICVLFNTMSVIGYRPLIISEEKCNDMRMRLGVFDMKPGISGYAQVCGRDDVHYKNKALLDAEYVKRASLWFDFKIFLKTIKVVLTRTGNHIKNHAKKDKKKAKKDAK